MSIEIKSFGKLPSGEEAQLYIMENSNGSSVEITNYGGIIRAINVPDRDGNVKNIALGYDSVEGYIPNNGYIGALIGRVGNRIGGARFTLNGVEHKLAKNDGDNHLHGGIEGFDRKLWKAIPIEGICEDSLILKYFSRDGEENYPGNLQVMVTYTFTDDDELVIHYEAIADQDTPVSLTNHCYFNLKGEGCGTIENHVIEINADSFTVVDDQCIPTGEQRPVDGTPFDLRERRVIA